MQVEVYIILEISIEVLQLNYHSYVIGPIHVEDVVPAFPVQCLGKLPVATSVS